MFSSLCSHIQAYSSLWERWKGGNHLTLGAPAFPLPSVYCCHTHTSESRSLKVTNCLLHQQRAIGLDPAQCDLDVTPRGEEEEGDLWH